MTMGVDYQTVEAGFKNPYRFFTGFLYGGWMGGD